MKIIAYDLGTGGVKASLYDEDMRTLAKVFMEYETYYSGNNMHEQKIEDWWEAVADSTKKLLADASINADDVGCVSLSGHSLVSIPLDKKGQALLSQVPIWSDGRAELEAKTFFETVDYESWYMTTGNGFPVALYSLFKLMWLKKHQPNLFEQIDKVIGSKDYINYRLTGEIATDYSYASGIGAYDLLNKCMNESYLQAAGISKDIFPEILSSHEIVGKIHKEAAEKIGLKVGTPVACGGVDNACMALGAVGAKEGSLYSALGSSSWVPVNSSTPVLDFKTKPYTFAHIEDGMYTSAYSIFAGGSSLRWAKENLCRDWSDCEDVYDLINEHAAKAEVGCNKIFFNPSLAGGSSQENTPNIRGSFIGLHLGTTRDDMLRAVMEGVCLNLKTSIDYLREKTHVGDEILFCGGGAKSDFWMQMFADVFNMNVITTNIDQDAASLGAAAIGARAIGLWQDYSLIETLHKREAYFEPDMEKVQKYEKISSVFNSISSALGTLGDYIEETL